MKNIKAGSVTAYNARIDISMAGSQYTFIAGSPDSMNVKYTELKD